MYNVKHISPAKTHKFSIFVRIFLENRSANYKGHITSLWQWKENDLQKDKARQGCKKSLWVGGTGKIQNTALKQNSVKFKRGKLSDFRKM